MDDLIARLAAVLRINGERWQALATGLDRDLLARRPEPGEWSALECLGHTVDTEEAIFTWRIRGFLTGVEVLPSYDPDVQGTPVTDATDPLELARQFAPRRAANVELVRTLEEEDLDRGSRHSELGPVSLREFLNEFWAHDTMHLVQAERALMQGFILDTGPWRSYFAEHDVAALNRRERAP
jgi:DinB superfamily